MNHVCNISSRYYHCFKLIIVSTRPLKDVVPRTLCYCIILFVIILRLGTISSRLYTPGRVRLTTPVNVFAVHPQYRTCKCTKFGNAHVSTKFGNAHYSIIPVSSSRVCRYWKPVAVTSFRVHLITIRIKTHWYRNDNY